MLPTVERVETLENKRLSRILLLGSVVRVRVCTVALEINCTREAQGSLLVKPFCTVSHFITHAVPKVTPAFAHRTPVASVLGEMGKYSLSGSSLLVFHVKVENIVIFCGSQCCYKWCGLQCNSLKPLG